MISSTRIPWSSLSSEMAEVLNEMLGEYDVVRREADVARERIRHLQELADAQPGMSLLNREALIRRMQGIASQTCDVPSTHTFVCLTLANAAQIRQRYGLAAIDAALSTVAEALCGAVRASDVVGSLGGYEFGVLLTLSMDRHATRKASQLAGLICRQGHPTNSVISLDVRWGVAPFGIDDDPRQVIADADLDLMRRQGVLPLCPGPQDRGPLSNTLS